MTDGAGLINIVDEDKEEIGIGIRVGEDGGDPM
jgi:hypothetical protein